MRRYFGIIATIILALVVLIALSATGSIEFDRPQESELRPIRSSYSTGPTGTRAFFQLLEESGRKVSRWRENYLTLDQKAGKSVLVSVGPFQFERDLPESDAKALKKWISEGGRALIISRRPGSQFADPVINSEITSKKPLWDASPELLVDPSSDTYVIQPTELTRGIKGLALSQLASRLKFYPPDDEPAEIAKEAQPGAASATETPPSTGSEDPDLDQILYAPVIHLGDKDGAIVADFNYGKGRVIFLSDPFVIANNGIARGSNLKLALNLLDSISSDENGSVRNIIFDEFHHGYFSRTNPLVNYFRGTPMPWLIAHGLLVCLLLLYTFGRRFARPLPTPRLDRHSPLEFVGSMANLQMVAQARELVIENIYPRFKARLCRRLALSSKAGVDDIITALPRQHLSLPESELRKVISDCELVIGGEKIDDAQLLKTVIRMRRILAQIKK
ncbi:MAG: DUF4350 domain-containing protein [Acidobacteria bacterium]|nr:DUF4350 domain-containing protein [Acidobacteriota bacterium]